MGIKRNVASVYVPLLLLVGGAATQNASAQSSVTLYGVVDGGILYANRMYDPITATNNRRQLSMIDAGMGPSLVGLTGAEDIGGGSKITFKLESGINVNSGGIGNSNGNLFGRQANVGIAGRWGDLKVGVQYSPFVLSIINTEPREASYFGSEAVIYLGNLFTTGIFAPNSITYTTPSINGIQGSAMVALGGQAGNFQSGRQYSARLKYVYGGLVVDAALFDGNAGGAVSTPVPTHIAFDGKHIGMSYSFGYAKLKASFSNYKIAGSFNDRVYSIGGDYSFSPAFKANGGVWIVSDGNNSSNHSILAAIGLDYLLSKRTSLYGAAAFVNNHGVMHTGISANGDLYGPTGTSAGVVVGVHHSF
ncbi:porin [Burkholderia stagnalis]|uniref:porin n=1 Tax=Burkholderia stagnalis TaxID=1503054 RepID=UPI0009BCE4B7|nr:porin [Burkholderia stagnalis]